MSFFATKSRISVATFKNVVGDGVFPPTPFTGTYWYAIFGDGEVTYASFGKVFYDSSLKNVYYFYKNSSDIKFGSFDTTYFDTRFSRITEYTQLDPLNQYDFIGNYRANSSYDLYFVGFKNDADPTIPTSIGTIVGFLSKFSSNGTPLWEKRDSKLDDGPGGNNYLGEGNNSSFYYDLAIDSSGNIFCIGSYSYLVTFIPFVTTDGLLFAKYSPSGSLLYQASYESPSNITYSSPKSTTMDSTNHFYMNVNHIGPGSSYVATTISKVSTNGTIVWTKNINVSYLDAIEATNNGTIGFMGTSTVVLGTHIGVMDSSGNMLWSKLIPSDVMSTKKGIAFDSQNNLYVTGVRLDPITFNFYNIIFKFNSSGSLVWQQKILGTFFVEGISVDGNDDLYISGVCENTPKFSMIKMPNTGTATGTYTIDADSITFQASSNTVSTNSLTATDYTPFSVGTNTYTIDDISTPHVTKTVTDTIDYTEIIAP